MADRKPTFIFLLALNKMPLSYNTRARWADVPYTLPIPDPNSRTTGSSFKSGKTRLISSSYPFHCLSAFWGTASTRRRMK